MRDRFALLGCAVLLMAVVATVALLQARSVAATPASEPALPAGAAAVSADVPDETSVALPVRLDEVPGASGFAQPGDHIDLWGYLSADLAGQPTTRLLVRDALVLESAGATDATLTLKVSPDDAVLLISAQRLGVRPFAILRSIDASVVEGLTSVSDAGVRDRLSQESTQPVAP
jgi:Flp pilus assembly protein CpaB